MPDQDLALAHLSDPHIALGRPRGAEWLGKRGLSGLSWLLRRRHLHDMGVAEALLADLAAAGPDAVAMTGDLANFGLAREFAAARAWLARLGPPERVLAVPGNHDALARGWEAPLRQHWGAWGDDGGWRRFGPVALIPVWSAVVTPPFMASGRVGAERRARLVRHLAEARAAGLTAVVAIHHPPTRITVRRKGLADGPEVVRLLAAGGAALVLHGHTHLRDLSWIDAPHGRIPVLGVPSLSMRPGASKPPGAWRMIRIRSGGGRVTAEVTEHAITGSGSIETRTPLLFELPALAPGPARTTMSDGAAAPPQEGARA